MSNMNKNSRFLLNFLMGTAVGGILGFLFAPKSGSELRKDLQDDLSLYLDKVKQAGNKIVDEAKKAGDDLIEKSNKLAALANKYLQGSYKESAGKIENEIKTVKNEINKTVNNYKDNNNKSENSPESIADDIFIDFVNENSEDYNPDFKEDYLPQHEGMKRRHDKKYL